MTVGPPTAGVVFGALVSVADAMKHGAVPSSTPIMLIFSIIGSYFFGALPAFLTGFLASGIYQPPGSLAIYLLVSVCTGCVIGGLIAGPLDVMGTWSAGLGLTLVTVPASLVAGATWWLFETGRL